MLNGFLTNIKKLLKGNKGKEIKNETTFSIMLCYLLNITYNRICLFIFKLLEKAKDKITKEEAFNQE